MTTRNNAVSRYRKGQVVRPISRAVAHDFNNLLQTAVSGLELVRIRTEQGRESEILPLIQKIQAAIIDVARLTRPPTASGEITESIHGRNGARHEHH